MRLTQELRDAGSIGDVLRLLSTGHADGVPLDVVHASAAWVSLAEMKSDFTDTARDSVEFGFLFKETQAALSNPDTSWRVSVSQRSPRNAGHPAAVILWSVATLHKSAPIVRQLVPLLAWHIKNEAPKASPQNVANAIWALGVMQAEQDGLDDTVSALVTRAFHVMNLFTSQALSNMSWGLARRSQLSYGICKLVASRLVSLAPSMNSRSIGLDLPQTTIAFALLPYRNDTFMETVASCVDKVLFRQERIAPWSLCALAWAFEEIFPSPGKDRDSQFDGVWAGRGVIRGNRLLWEAGRTVTLTYGGNGQVSFKADDGTAYFGQLSDNGQNLQWSDGDTWVRMGQPFAAFQIRLHSQVKRHGLLGSVANACLGPERWYENNALKQS